MLPAAANLPIIPPVPDLSRLAGNEQVLRALALEHDPIFAHVHLDGGFHAEPAGDNPLERHSREGGGDVDAVSAMGCRHGPRGKFGQVGDDDPALAVTPAAAHEYEDERGECEEEQDCEEVGIIPPSGIGGGCPQGPWAGAVKVATTAGSRRRTVFSSSARSVFPRHRAAG